jgi:hypothetical protein
MPSVGLIVIATGQRYWPYIDPVIGSAFRYFLPHDLILFTDDKTGHACWTFPVVAQGYPMETLHRYHTILDHANVFTSYSHIFYIDVDSLFVAPVGEEILCDGITATLHAGFREGFGAWETRYESMACVPPVMQKRYYCGGFNGGSREAYLTMARSIRSGVEADAAAGFMAKWHDESFLNRYLAYHLPAKVLSSNYCFPEPVFLKHPSAEVKIICLEKSLRP